MFGRATITLGIGPHSSYDYYNLRNIHEYLHTRFKVTNTLYMVKIDP